MFRGVGTDLGCQFLGSLSLVLPSTLRQVTAHVSWSLLHEKRPMSQLWRMFVLVARKHFHCIQELKPSLFPGLLEQSITQATLSG